MNLNCIFKRQVAVITFLIVSLAFLVGTGEAAKAQLRVKVSQANIRLKPSATSLVISKAPIGAILESDEKIGFFK